MNGKMEQSFNERKAERSFLTTYTIHLFCMFAGIVMMDTNRFVPFLVLFLIVACWVVYLRQKGSYRDRVFFTVVAVQASLILYVMNTQEILSVIPPFLAIVVLMGLYGIPELLITGYITFTLIIIYHLCIEHIFCIRTIDDIYRYLFPILSTYSVIWVTHFLVIQREKSRKRMMGIIQNLKSAELSKDDFMANVSHEIRTPINTISGMSEVILREELPEHIREKVQDIQSSGRNLLSVVNDMLDFSELQSGKQTLVEVSYNITSTINDVINMANAWKGDKNIELIVDCDTDIPRSLIGDEQKIRRVILGLVNNAFKFTNDGCVTIEIGFRKEKYGINLFVSVRDTGIGIDEAHQEKLFTTFSQVDTKRNRQEGGVGLGLAIAQALIEQMGGYLSVKSHLGKGSEFQFVIPQKVEEMEPIISIGNIINKFNILIYVDMEQFDMMTIRDEYTNMIIHMTSQLNVRFHLCRNLAEFKRRVEREVYTHAFISFKEYKEDENYFEDLSQKIKIVAIVEPFQNKEIQSLAIMRMFKPFYVLSVVRILRGEGSDSTRSQNYYKRSHFVAPEAKVLVVDDNLINLKVVSGLLKPYQIKVETALSGAEALEKIERRDFDLVFMDHMMPEMDGIEAFHRIRKKKGMYFKEVPIIALTANAVAGAREMFLAEGFQDFVAKPIELSVLERSLKSFLPEEKISLVEHHISVANPQNDEPVREWKANANSYENQTSQVILDTKHVEPQIVRKEEKVVEPKDNKKNDLDLGDIDVEQGITYCGSMEDYLEILELHYKDGKENREKIQKYYDEHDWKNYTILVHGLKSSMKTVGVMKLSDMAKLLEAAGKTNDEKYILDNHHVMMEEYQRILDLLKLKFGSQEDEEEQVLDLEELSEERMEHLLNQFEDAVFTWEENNMRQVIDEMQNYQYHKKAMKEPLQVIYRKIEMSDYMSALDTLKSLVEKWKKG